MRRKYNTEMAKKSIGHLKAAFPNLMLSADVITGFPGETEEDFTQTLEFFKEQKFLHLHIFPYSKRVGTPAAEMENQVPDDIKKERLHRLEAQQKKIKLELLSDFINKTAQIEVLFESYDGEFALGHSPNFIEVRVKSSYPLGGKFIKVKPIRTDGEAVFGEIL